MGNWAKRLWRAAECPWRDVCRAVAPALSCFGRRLQRGLVRRRPPSNQIQQPAHGFVQAEPPALGERTQPGRCLATQGYFR